MKSINLAPLFFLTNPLRAISNNHSSESNSGKTPYLKAILSGKTGSARNPKQPSAVNEDREAAIRYIKESIKARK